MELVGEPQAVLDGHQVVVRVGLALAGLHSRPHAGELAVHQLHSGVLRHQRNRYRHHHRLHTFIWPDRDKVAVLVLVFALQLAKFPALDAPLITEVVHAQCCAHQTDMDTLVCLLDRRPDLRVVAQELVVRRNHRRFRIVQAHLDHAVLPHPVAVPDCHIVRVEIPHPLGQERVIDMPP